MQKVLITNRVPDDVLAPLRDIAEVIQGQNDDYKLMSRAEVLELAPELVGIINQAELKVDEELLDAAPNLKIVANVAIGIDNLDLPLLTKRGVWATNTPDFFVDSTADCTLGLLLSLARRLLPADHYIRSGQWDDDGFRPGMWDGVELHGKTLGIVGYGRIGQAVAKRARAFDMNVIYVDPSASSDGGARDLPSLLLEADFVSLHVPLTKETRHMITSAQLQKMKPTAYLINMARGPVIKETDIVQALKQEIIAGAALDVFEFEPEVHDDLIAMPHVILTPHIGGGTHESRYKSRRLCAENIARVLTGHVPLTPVNKPEIQE